VGVLFIYFQPESEVAMVNGNKKLKAVRLRIWACEQLLKRYVCHGEISYEECLSCVATCISEQTTPYQKMAARVMLKYYLGTVETNNLLESEAVVTERRDPLVRRWRNKVLARDKYKCVKCGATDRLVAHHVIYWSEDITKRISVENGMTLCEKCHAKEHEGERVYALIAKNR